ELLGDQSLEIAWQAEELLRWAAGDEAPASTIATANREARTTCQKAWQDWWRLHGAKTDLAERFSKDFRRPGLFVACWYGPEGAAVRLYGCDGVPRWDLKASAPRDVQMTAGPRIIVADEDVKLVSAEYEPDGKIIWQQQSFGISCQRLPNGNTFLAGDS